MNGPYCDGRLMSLVGRGGNQFNGGGGFATLTAHPMQHIAAGG